MEDVKNKILPVEEVDENEQIAIRKEKLDTMRANGFAHNTLGHNSACHFYFLAVVLGVIA